MYNYLENLPTYSKKEILDIGSAAKQEQNGQNSGFVTLKPRKKCVRVKLGLTSEEAIKTYHF